MHAQPSGCFSRLRRKTAWICRKSRSAWCEASFSMLPTSSNDTQANHGSPRLLENQRIDAAARVPFGFATPVAYAAVPAAADYDKVLVLIELKGGNDGLNTLVPFTDPAYYVLRPKLAVSRDRVIALTDSVGLHPSLEPLFPLWKERELAVLQGVGYP